MFRRGAGCRAETARRLKESTEEEKAVGAWQEVREWKIGREHSRGIGQTHSMGKAAETDGFQKGQDHRKPVREPGVDNEGEKAGGKACRRGQARSNLVLLWSAAAFAFSGGGETDFAARKMFGQPAWVRKWKLPEVTWVSWWYEKPESELLCLIKGEGESRGCGSGVKEDVNK